MNTAKQRALEICRNLSRTISTFTSTVQSLKMEEFSPKPKLSALKRKRRELMSKYELTEKDLK
jgi:hypothetical protein